MSNITLPLHAMFSLSSVGRNPTLRLDAKQADPNSQRLDELLDGVDTVFLSELLPEPFVKGAQPSYLPEGNEEAGASVISTLAVRPLSINFNACRSISRDAFGSLSISRRLRDGDVLLTTDGGTSIGKVAVFASPLHVEDQDVDMQDVGFTVDSHVAILRPAGITPELLAYLLCSPMGQLQFQRAESGASGQTSVSEEDVRRFRFPRAPTERFEAAAQSLTVALARARRLEIAAHRRRELGWQAFEDTLLHVRNDGSPKGRIRARVRPTELRRLQTISN